MVLKSRTEDTRGRHHTTRDGRYSLVGLGHILPNSVLTCHLYSLTLCMDFCSIENDRRPMGDVRRIQ
jgi:hypothetical protein